MPELTDEYAAGFFDGEGSVYAAIQRRHSKYESPTILVCISNTNRDVLEMHMDKWGGSLHERKKHNGRQRQYQWVLCSRGAKVFLNAIAPHVLIKRDVVLKAIEYRELMETPHRERLDYKKGGVTKPAFRRARDKLHKEISALNAKSAPYNALRQKSA